ncbi:MAG: acyl-CoA synthetase [Proteobacteria bacterium]|nr:acyl-CoA synthetase [Pseudomonadota bacterium]
MQHTRAHAQNSPDRPAYIMAKTGEVVTFGQLEDRANRCSQYFRDIGLQSGDRIAILMENNAQYLEVVSAAKVAGLHYAAISTHFKLSEIEYIINDCEAKLIVTSKYMSQVASDLIDLTPTVAHRLMVGGTIPGYESYEETVAGFPSTPIPEIPEGRDMLYSSGTTGRPKGVVSTIEPLPFGEVHPSALGMITICGFNPEMIYLSPAPLYHAAPLRFCLWALLAGGTVVVMDRFDAEEALSLIDKYKITHSQWVPTMFIRMLKLPEEVRTRYDVSSQKTAIHAAAPCPVAVKEQMIEWWGPVVFEYYAGTEGNTFTGIFSDEWLTHKGSVGRCFLGTLHILDENDDEVPVGTPGAIYAEGGNTFEYHKDPEKTAASRSKQGWNSIGDVGYLDEEGYLYMTDRKANMIISGGVNIYPQETENILSVHPKVYDVAVFGVPNEDFGEEVKAVVQLTDMNEASPELEKELIEYCRERLSTIKCPKSIDFKAELPRTPTGKLLKRLLKDVYWDEQKKSAAN